MRVVRNVAFMLAGLAAMAAAPAAEPVAGLRWLSGAWVSDDGGAWTEELWTAPRGGVMLGTNRSGKGDRITGFEFMRIAADEAGVVSFWGSPAGKPAVPFRLTSFAPGEAIFENPAHDFPTRIAYRRDGEALLATVSGSDGGNAQSWTFRRPQSRAEP